MTDGDHDCDPAETLSMGYVAALRLLEQGDITHARREFEILTFDAPGFAPGWDGLGNCCLAEGEVKAAARHFRRAVQVDPGNWRSRYAMGAALNRQGEPDAALRWLRPALRGGNEERLIQREIGRSHAACGRWKPAAAAFEAALKCPEREVSDAELHLELAQVHAESGHFEAADEAFQRACLLEPGHPDLYYQWAIVTARSGDYAGAQRLAARAVSLERRTHRAALLQVTLALEAGDGDMARARLNDLEARTGLARLCETLRAELALQEGCSALAREFALSALRMPGDPADEAVDRALAVLRRLEPREVRCRGYRFVLEVTTGEGVYFRPYVVLAPSEEEALHLTTELQEALDVSRWRLAERETFAYGKRAQPGVYQVLLTRVLFPVEDASFTAGRIASSQTSG